MSPIANREGQILDLTGAAKSIAATILATFQEQ
jgi:hypothetical protein